MFHQRHHVGDEHCFSHNAEKQQQQPLYQENNKEQQHNPMLWRQQPLPQQQPLEVQGSTFNNRLSFGSSGSSTISNMYTHSIDGGAIPNFNNCVLHQEPNIFKTPPRSSLYNQSPPSSFSSLSSISPPQDQMISNNNYYAIQINDASSYPNIQQQHMFTSVQQAACSTNNNNNNHLTTQINQSNHDSNLPPQQQQQGRSSFPSSLSYSLNGHVSKTSSNFKFNPIAQPATFKGNLTTKTITTSSHNDDMFEQPETPPPHLSTTHNHHQQAVLSKLYYQSHNSSFQKNASFGMSYTSSSTTTTINNNTGPILPTNVQLLHASTAAATLQSSPLEFHQQQLTKSSSLQNNACVVGSGVSSTMSNSMGSDYHVVAFRNNNGNNGSDYITNMHPLESTTTKSTVANCTTTVTTSPVDQQQYHQQQHQQYMFQNHPPSLYTQHDKIKKPRKTIKRKYQFKKSESKSSKDATFPEQQVHASILTSSSPSSPSSMSQTHSCESKCNNLMENVFCYTVSMDGKELDLTKYYQHQLQYTFYDFMNNTSTTSSGSNISTGPISIIRINPSNYDLRNFKRSVDSISKDEMLRVLHLTQQQASIILGCSVSTIKRRFYGMRNELGLTKWPNNYFEYSHMKVFNDIYPMSLNFILNKNV